MTILERVEAICEKSSKSEKKLCQFILMNTDLVIGYNANDLSEKTSISNSTVTRFCQKLGFDGYIDFKNQLFEEYKEEKNRQVVSEPMDRLNQVLNTLNTDKGEYINMLKADVRNLTHTFDTLDLNEIQDIVDALSNVKKRIFIIGFNSCSIMAQFFAFHFSRMGANIELITGGGSTLYEKLGHADDESIAFLITFSRYSKDSKEVMKIVKNNECPLIVMTDKENTFTRRANYSVTVNCENVFTFYNSQVVPMAVANIIITAYAIRNPEETAKSVNKIASQKEKSNIFLKE